MNKRPKILVVGSLMMNHGIETSVIPEEGQTVMGEDIQKSPGGKGANQAVQMARLGADVTKKQVYTQNRSYMMIHCRQVLLSYY